MFRAFLALAIYLGLDFLAAWWMMAFLGTPPALVVAASEARKS